MRRLRRTGRLSVCALCVLLLVSASAGAAQPTADARSVEQPAAGGLVVQQDDEANNTTQHEDPDTVDESGDSAAVASWLRSELSSRLGNSTLQLSNGQYEQAKSVLGDDYSDSLGKLVDVAGETDGGGGDEDGDGGDGGTEETAALNDTRTTQRAFVDAVQSFRETQDAYEAAKERGNETRARQLARDLQDQGTRVAALSNRLVDGYGRLANVTSRSFEEPVERIEAVATNVSEARRSVVVAEFVQTRLTVSRVAANASFTDPVTLTGRLHAPNGTRAPNGTVALRVGDRTLEPTLDADGRFEVQYRPVTAAVGQQRVDVEYVPRTDSVFLGSATNTTVTVTAVTPTVDLAVDGDPFRFGQSAAVTGRVTANGTGVPGVPLAVRVGGVRVGTVETADDGRFRYAGSIPATAPLGQQPLTATVALEDRAIRPASAERTVTVAETATNLSVRGDWRADSVSLSGRLTAADGTPVPDQPVQLVHDGTQLATVRTGDDGRYGATVDAAGFAPNGTQNVTAVYATEGGNLGNATATVELTPPPAASGDGESGSASGSAVPGLVRDGGLWLVVGAVVLLGASAGGVYWWRRRTPAAGVDSSGEMPTKPVSSDGGDVDASPDAADPLAPAATALDAGEDPDDVVRLAYSAARRALAADSAEESDAGTHWEFFHAHADATSRPDDFRALTTAYERTKYAPEGATREDASDAVEAARRLLDDRD